MRRTLPTLILSALVLLALLSLGTWQVNRLAWKKGELAKIEARIQDAPVDIPDNPDPKSDLYLPVAALGTITADELHVLVSTRDWGAGYRVVSAFETDGRRVMLDRGYIRLERKDDDRPATEASVAGNLHWPDEIDSYTPDNDLERNIWFARDVETMAAALQTEPILIIARKTSETDPTVTPLPVDTSGIPNDHLEYVVTWYGLALVWVIMTFYFLRRMGAQRKGEDT